MLSYMDISFQETFSSKCMDNCNEHYDYQVCNPQSNMAVGNKVIVANK